MKQRDSFVFVSYSRDDYPIVKKLTDDLQSQGVEIWIDEHGLSPSTIDWEMAIRTAVKSARAVLLLASQASCESPFVRHELAIAEVSGCPIYVIWIAGEVWADCVPMGYYARQRIDARGEDYPQALKEMVSILSEDITEPMQRSEIETKHIYLGYNHSSELEVTLAQAIEIALADNGYSYNVDDLAIPLGTEGVQHLREEIGNCHYFIALLSEQSVNSEVLRAEIEFILEINETRETPIKILPVRVRYRDRFPYQLRKSLNHISWTLWDGDTDTTRVMDDILSAVKGGELSISSIQEKLAVIRTQEFTRVQQPSPYADPTGSQDELEHATGTISPFSQFYVERSQDDEMLGALEKREATIVIKAPRQMGKSSMVLWGCQIAREIGYRVAFLDFQLLDNRTLFNEERLIKTFCRQTVAALGLNVPDIGDKWKPDMGGVFQCAAYFTRNILRRLDAPMLLAIDEIDRLFESPFRSSFFGMLRNWHNNRAYDEKWQEYHQILVISTEPYMLIENLNQSPFNVGRVIALDDFSRAQVEQLNAAHGDLLTDVALETLYGLIGGHPYLWREAMYQIASGKTRLDELVDTAVTEQGPFADHLRHFLFLLDRNPDLQQVLLQIIHKHRIPSDSAVARLQSAGLVKWDDKGLRVRCQLYERYFASRLQG